MRIQIYHHTQKGSALLISLIILILVTLLTTVFLEVIWSSSKNVQGIEASNAAYYQTIGVVEEQLIAPTVSKKTPWNIATVSEGGAGFSTGRSLDVQTGSSIMPEAGYGNSPYDDNYNIISLGEPVQIVIPHGIIWSDVDFYFKIPKIGSGSTILHASLANSGVVLWTLGYTGASLYASGETNIIRGLDIDNLPFDISSYEGISNSGSNSQLGVFYTNPTYLGNAGANCNPYNCTLKLSMIRPVKTIDNVSIPFLEYKIIFNKDVPSQFMTLDASAYAYGFQRTRRTRIPQITTNTALDFAVLQ